MSQLAPARPLPRTAARRTTAATPRQLKVVAPPETSQVAAFDTTLRMQAGALMPARLP